MLNLVCLDPLSALDPATAELTETRQLVERALFTVQRLPSGARHDLSENHPHANADDRDEIVVGVERRIGDELQVGTQ